MKNRTLSYLEPLAPRKKIPNTNCWNDLRAPIEDLKHRNISYTKFKHFPMADTTVFYGCEYTGKLPKHIIDDGEILSESKE